MCFVFVCRKGDGSIFLENATAALKADFEMFLLNFISEESEREVGEWRTCTLYRHVVCFGLQVTPYLRGWQAV